MKFFGVLVVVCWLNIASGMVASNQGRTELHSESDSSTQWIFVGYQICLNFPPTIVKATVSTRYSSLPHKFKATVGDIDSSGFWVNLERTDQSTGWKVDLIIDWELYFEDCSGILYSAQCIWMPEPSKVLLTTRAQAEDMCREFGAALVDIVDKNMYDVVYDYAKTTLISVGASYTRYWLAMNYNPTTSTMSTSRGLPAHNSDWYRGHPSSDASFTGMLLYVSPESNTMSTSIGLFNYSPNGHLSAGKLCAKSF